MSLSGNKRCKREDCPMTLTRSTKYEYCSLVCAALVNEFDSLQRMPAIATPEGTEAWLTLVEIADMWSRYQPLQRRLFHLGQNAAARQARPAAAALQDKTRPDLQ